MGNTFLEHIYAFGTGLLSKPVSLFVLTCVLEFFFASSNLTFFDLDFAPRKLVGLIPYKTGLVKTMC